MRIATRKLCLVLVAYLVLVAAIVLLFVQDARAQDSFEGMAVEEKDGSSQPAPINPTETETKKETEKETEKETAKEAPSAATADTKVVPPTEGEGDSNEGLKIGKTEDPNENKPLGESGAKGTLPGGDVMTVFLYLGAIVALIVISLVVFKKFLPGGNRLFQSKVIEILGRTFIAPKQGLFLIKVADRILLVGSTGSAISTLCEITDPDEMLRVKELAGSGAVGVSEGLSSAFRSILGRNRGKFDPERAEIAAGKAKGEMGKIKNMISNWRERHSD